MRIKRMTPEILQAFERDVKKGIAEGEDGKERFQSLLAQGRELRLLSDKHAPFWDLSQKKIHRLFDAAYGSGIDILAQQSSLSLNARMGFRMTQNETIQKTAHAGAGALGGFSGWLLGLLYTHSMSHLILHEQGHGWAMQMLFKECEPQLSTNAQYWLEKGEWGKWIRGEREGGPGNWEHLPSLNSQGNPYELTVFGKSLTENQRALWISGGGLLAEMAANTLLATLGLLAIRKKQRFFGGALLGFALISHSAAHSYLRRYDGWPPSSFTHSDGADPLQISHFLSKEYGCSLYEAFQALRVSYALFPLVFLGALSLFLFYSPPEIPDEIVLIRLLREQDRSALLRELARPLTEVEVETDLERLELAKQEAASGGSSEERRSLTRKKRAFAEKIMDKVLAKIHDNKGAFLLFNKMKKEMEAELKGKLQATLPKTSSLRAVAGVTALVAQALLSLQATLFPKVAIAVSLFKNTFFVAQGICSLLDVMQLVNDLRNEALSFKAKMFSTMRTVINLASCLLMAISFFVPGLNLFIIPCVLVFTGAGLLLTWLNFREINSLARFRELIQDTPLWDQELDEAKDLMAQVRETSGSSLRVSFETLFLKRASESKEEHQVRLQEIKRSLQWLEAQEKGASLALLSQRQKEAIKDILQSVCEFKPESFSLSLPRWLSVLTHGSDSRRCALSQ